MNARRFRTGGLLLAALCGVTAAAEMTVVSWNVESGGADPATLAQRIRDLDGVDLWGLSEVQSSSWAQQFERAAEEDEPGDFYSFLGTTGDSDRLLILYDSRQFTELERFEMTWADRPWYRPTMRLPQPLVAKLRHNATGQEFFFMVNHLCQGRGAESRRLDQATALNEWAAAQTLPVIAVGNYNFDYDLDLGADDENYEKGFGNMIRNAVFTWVFPEPLVATHCSPQNRILDFVFLANATGVMTGASEVLEVPGDCPDDDRTSDHRPIRAVLTIGHGGTPSLREQILDRIAQMERDLAELKALLEQMGG